MLEPINTTIRYKEVQEKIRKFILEGSLQPGSRLPSENELANQLAVSRNAVREALKGLEAQGMIEVKAGLGTFVKQFSLEQLLTNFAYSFLFDGDAVAELYAIRKQLELGFIKEAVRNVTDHDIADMRAILKKMSEQAEQGLLYPDQDMALHRIIYRGIDNQSLLKLLDVFRVLYDSASFLSGHSQEIVWQDLQNHIDLVEAIADRDEERAWICLNKHFLDVRKFSLMGPSDQAREKD